MLLSPVLQDGAAFFLLLDNVFQFVFQLYHSRGRLNQNLIGASTVLLDGDVGNEFPDSLEHFLGLSHAGRRRGEVSGLEEFPARIRSVRRNRGNGEGAEGAVRGPIFHRDRDYSGLGGSGHGHDGHVPICRGGRGGGRGRRGQLLLEQRIRAAAAAYTANAGLPAPPFRYQTVGIGSGALRSLGFSRSVFLASDRRWFRWNRLGLEGGNSGRECRWWTGGSETVRPSQNRPCFLLDCRAERSGSEGGRFCGGHNPGILRLRTAGPPATSLILDD